MPGPWVSASSDPEAWASLAPNVGDYLEFVAYDSGLTKQGTVLARVDAVSERTGKGQWMEITILATSDDHLSWWLTDGGGKDDHWQFELHLCKTTERSCKQPKRGRGMDFHSDKVRTITIGDLADRKIDWVKKGKHKKYVDEEVARMSGDLPTGKEAVGSRDQATLGFDEGHRLPPPDKSAEDDALRGLTQLEADLASPKKAKKKKKKKKRKKAPADSAHGRVLALRLQLAEKKKESRDRGPFGSGHKLDYDGEVFRDGPPSDNGTSLQLRLVEYSVKRPGRLAARLLQRMQAMVGKEGGPTLIKTAYNKTPPVATNWVLTVLGPKQFPMRLLREMKTLATVLDQIAAGRSHAAADVVAQRLKALELSQSDGSWNRAQFLELLEAEGPSLLEREEAVMASKEWAGELRMRTETVKEEIPDYDPPTDEALVEAMLSLKSALGTFARVHANPERLPPGAEPTSSGDRPGHHGDVLPLHPSLILPGLKGVTSENIHWVRAVFIVSTTSTARPGQSLCVSRWSGPDELKEAIQDPAAYLLPVTELPERHRGSRVRADDEQWHKIVKAGYDRGMFTAVKDEDVPVDRKGHLITNRAGGVAKVKQQTGAQDSLPYIGQLTAILADKDSYMVLDSEDLHSAFNLFWMPPVWAPYFSFAKKPERDGEAGADGSSHGLDVGRYAHPGGDQAHLLCDCEGDQPLPEGESNTVLYLDNFDEIRYLNAEIALREEGQPSENHGRFVTACEMLGLPRNLGKQLSGALSGTLQGGEILGKEKILRHAYDKSVELLELSLGLLTMELADEFTLRHWCGKAAFAAAFRRPLYAILQEVYCTMDWAKTGTQVSLEAPVLDEILSFAVLLPLAETDLSSELSEQVSCTDAFPTGGGSSVATTFKDKSLLLPLPLEDKGDCGSRNGGPTRALGSVGRDFVRSAVPGTMRETASGNGGMFHRLGNALLSLVSACQRRWASRALPPNRRWAPASGATRDFKTEPGKDRLDNYEAQADLLWSHWSPERLSFSAQREEASGMIEGNGTMARGSFEKRHELVTLRQANAMAKNPGEGEWYWSIFSLCCHGGSREEWLTVVHNSASLHAVLHKPTCEGHRHEVISEAYVDPENQDPYPWAFCLVFAEGVHDELSNCYCEPFGGRTVTLETLMPHQLRGATRGLQDGAAVDWAVSQMILIQFLETMDAGAEEQHLRDPSQHGKRFFNIVDPLVTFYVLGKGLIPMTLWTISKWNYSDGASRKYELPATMGDLDEELSEYINHLWQEGDNVSLAGWTVSGLKRFFPRCRPFLQTSQLYLRNWHRVHMPARTNPLPWLATKAMAAAAARVGRYDLALLVLLGFAFFLRTMELLSLQVTHLRIFPQDGTILQSLSLREPQLAAILTYILHRVRPSKHLYSFSPLVFRRGFAALVATVGFSPDDYLPYSMRGEAPRSFTNATALGAQWYKDVGKTSPRVASMWTTHARLLSSFLCPPHRRSSTLAGFFLASGSARWSSSLTFLGGWRLASVFGELANDFWPPVLWH
ncbi:unnamed protein product [Symbiodinium sp. CCMP2592]|nr:unnamed protein product [Symbiodinium sp. CCMP2592]